MDLGVMAMKGYATFTKAPEILGNLTIRLFSINIRILVGEGGSYPSAEVQSVYSTAPADWAI